MQWYIHLSESFSVAVKMLLTGCSALLHWAFEVEVRVHNAASQVNQVLFCVAFLKIIWLDLSMLLIKYF